MWRVTLALLALLCVTASAAWGAEPADDGDRRGAPPTETTPAPVGRTPAEILREQLTRLEQAAQRPPAFQTTRIFDRHGALLTQIADRGHRTIVPLEAMAPTLRLATIATEDATFYENPGFESRALLRAAWSNWASDEVMSGASTITMQLVRQLVFTEEERLDRSFERKAREVFLAMQFAQSHTKDEVLALYLNTVYYGHLAYGAEAAAQVYFGKPAAQLTLPEAALLAGLPQAPSILDPYLNPKGAKERQRQVLALMAKAGFIRVDEAEAAAAVELRFAPTAPHVSAPHFADWVRGLLVARYGEEALRQGLRITTTLDLRYQALAQDLVRRQVAGLREKHNLSNAALVALQPGTGQILAMVGGVDYLDAGRAGQVNVALRERQTGSAIKPVTYAAALEAGYSPASVLWDVPVEYTLPAPQPKYAPKNYDGKFHGPVRMREALANSYNVPAVKLLERVGLPKFLDVAHRLGIAGLRRPPAEYGLATTLGASGVTLVELTTAYGTLANGGGYVAPAAILRVEDAQGRVLEEWRPTQPEARLDARIAYLLTHMMADDAARQPAFGPRSPLLLSRPAAVKTGTTDDYRDNWTVGYTTDLVVGVWAGNTDNAPMRGVTGVTGAAPIWRDFMERVYKDAGLAAVRHVDEKAAARDFRRPSGLVERQVCNLATLRVGQGCEPLVSELFIAERELRDPGVVYRQGQIAYGRYMPPRYGETGGLYAWPAWGVGELPSSVPFPVVYTCTVEENADAVVGSGIQPHFRLPTDAREAAAAQAWLARSGGRWLTANFCGATE